MNNANWSVIAQVLKTYFPGPQTQSSPKPLSRFTQFRTQQVQGNINITNLYIPKTSVSITIFFTPAMVKYMKKNLDITNKFCQSLGPSSYRGSTVPRKIITHFRLASLPRLHFTMSDQVRNTYAGVTLSAREWGREGGVGGGGKIFLYLGRRQWHQSPTKLSEGAALTGKWTCYQTEETDRNASERTEWSHCKDNKFGGRVKRRKDEIPVSWPSRETLKVSVILNCANKRET